MWNRVYLHRFHTLLQGETEHVQQLTPPPPPKSNRNTPTRSYKTNSLSIARENLFCRHQGNRVSTKRYGEASISKMGTAESYLPHKT